MSSKLIDFMVKYNHYTEQDAEDELVNGIVKMTDPRNFKSEHEMKSHLYEYLGFNPDTYYKRCDLNVYLEEILKSAPTSVKIKIIESRKEILEQTLKDFDSIEYPILGKLLLHAIADITGWEPTSEDGLAIEDLVNPKYLTSNQQEEDDDFDDIPLGLYFEEQVEDDYDFDEDD